MVGLQGCFVGQVRILACGTQQRCATLTPTPGYAPPPSPSSHVARYMVHGESHGIKPPRGSSDQLRTCGYHGSSFVWIHSSLRSTQPLASPAFHLLPSSSTPLPGSARHPRINEQTPRGPDFLNILFTPRCRVLS